MSKCRLKRFVLVLAASAVTLCCGAATGQESSKQDVNVTTLDKMMKANGRVTPSQRKAAAERNAQLGLKVGTKAPASSETGTTPASVSGDEKPVQEPDQVK
jgi:hypothetical protein